MMKIIICLLIVNVGISSAFTQVSDFSGIWVLDKEKSNLDQHQADFIESQILTVVQNNTSISITIATIPKSKVKAGVDIGGGTDTYTFDGKETETTKETMIGTMHVKRNAEIIDGKLNLYIVRTIITKTNDEIRSTTEEAWKISKDATTLTISRESQTQNKIISSEFVYSRKK